MSIKPHAFVLMPGGSQPDAEGHLIHFDRIYDDYIRPGLLAAGFEVVRAEAETKAGAIRHDLFQELLVADLVVADITIQHPSVWYELGIRHALRSRGVVLVSGEKRTAFDAYTDRKLRYNLRDGAPDAATMESDQRKLSIMAKATMESWRGRTLSPVYALLPNYREPDWNTLRVEGAREFWAQHDTWLTRVKQARQSRRIGDILVLAEEAPVAAFRAEAWSEAGAALLKSGQFDLALESLERCVAIDPANLGARRDIGICLQRLALRGVEGFSLDRARAHYRAILEEHPDDSETWALLGRVDKDAWIEAWRRAGRTAEQLREDAGYEEALLRAAIDGYENGFRRNPGHYSSGRNAITLMHLYRHLTQDSRYQSEAELMAGAVRYAALNEPDEAQAFWACSTLADLEVLGGTVEGVSRAYLEAVAKSGKERFAVESCKSQLQLLKVLGLRPDQVEAALAVLDRAIEDWKRPAEALPPRYVLLFSGHMIDDPDRPAPRFPPDKEPIAAAKIAEVLDQLEAGSEDLALAQAACGGDLLFTEACQARGVRVQWMLPFPEEEFVERSVACGGESWRDRYRAARSILKEPVRVAPVDLGEPPQGTEEGYAYERCNLWLLHTALCQGVSKLRFVCLWNGSGGDGPGGTAHMVHEVKRRSGWVAWIDTRKAW
ncbi:MAG: tetratricopeptide repeat protein [Verrucomicrobiales bacterium]|nr:tetratricopeptide repeat protein [Verrucomicrobiales bacterium]